MLQVKYLDRSNFEKTNYSYPSNISPKCAFSKYPPKISISTLVNSLKGVSSRHIRKANYPEVRTKLWGSKLWSPSYFASSCGGISIDVIKKYIESQKA